MENMNQDYYVLDNGKSAVYYVYEYALGFSYGNAFKYCTRAGKKEGNSAEKDFNKALVYILSSNNEVGFFHRLAKSMYNTWKFNDKIQFAPRSLADILCAIIQFKDRKTIAKMIVQYMISHDIEVKEEFKKYA